MKMITYKEFKDYMNIFDECYPNPPKDSADITLNMILRNNCEIELQKHKRKIIGGAIVVKNLESFYTLEGVIIKPEYQRRNHGTRLIKRINKKYKGTIILETRKKDFYKRLGYISLDNKQKGLMIRCV